MRKTYLLLTLILSCLFSACTLQEPVQTTEQVEAATATEQILTESAAATPEPEETTSGATEPKETVPDPVTEYETVPFDEDFVKVSDWIPSVRQELFYATDRNFTGQVIYDFENAYLRYGTVKKLMAVSKDLEELGLGIKIWDGFRPVSAQFKLWEIYPDPTYVANPTVGYSSHSRGNTVDLTLVDENGVELEMPTGFDDFSAKADRDYSDCTESARNNAEILEMLMEKHGFTGYWGEWWHYSDTVSYPVEEVLEPSLQE